MTIRLVCVAMSKSNLPIIEQIKAISPSSLQVVLEIGSEKADYKGTSLSRMTRKRGKSGHLMEKDAHSGAALPVFQSPDYKQNMVEFISHLERRDVLNDPFPHPIRQLSEYLDYFHILADALATKITEAKATHIIFFEIPHLGYDTIAYQIARALDLKIIILTQAQFDGKFLSMPNLDMLGKFSDRVAQDYQIDRSERPDLFYMKGIGQNKTKSGHLSFSMISRILAGVAWHHPSALANPIYLLKILSRARAVANNMPDWRDPFSGFFHLRDLAYFEHLVTLEDGKIDLSGDYVYFPLQFEPEMTTAALGGIYADQALAIEHLADMLPPGVRILVKENPKQAGHARGPMFFHRLRRISSVHFLPSFANTHELTAHARFVATITGTAGWEAIRQGIPALVFGRAWYLDLPGAVPFHRDLEYQQIAGLTWDHAELERRTGALIAGMHDGHINRHFLKVAQVDQVGNARNVAEQVIDLLTGKRKMTFDAEA